MTQRIITGVVSAALLVLVMYIRGALYDIAISLIALFGCYEMIRALKKAGLRPAELPIYGMGVLMLPIFILAGNAGIYIAGALAMLMVMLVIVLRKQPRWLDAAASFQILFSVPIPLMMLYPMIRIQPEMLGALLSMCVFAIALLGDTFAYFVGVAVGTHKMAPEISPKKTWEGSVGGLLGSIAGALLLCTSGAALTQMPPLWHFALLGLIGGVAGQLGDLSASLVKRYCGVKDYGTLFPGHGGMMDRLDSIIFVCYVLFGYCLVTGLT